MLALKIANGAGDRYKINQHQLSEHLTWVANIVNKSWICSWYEQEMKLELTRVTASK